ncbi:MAG: WD40 repeat domain-containing protein [Fervidobacterium sp.]
MKKLKYIKMCIAYLIIFIMPSVIWAQSLDTNLLPIMHKAKKMVLPSDTKQTGEVDKQTGTYIISFIGSDETGQYVDKIRFDKNGNYLEVVSPRPLPERIFKRLAKIGVSLKDFDAKTSGGEVKSEPLSDKIYLPIELIKKPNFVTFLPVEEYDGVISPDGKLLAAVKATKKVKDKYEYEVILQSIETYKILAALPGRSPICFSPDGKILAIYPDDSYRSIVFWDIGKIWDSGKAEKLNTVIPVVRSDDETFSPDGKLFALSDNFDIIKLYDIATGKKIWTFNNKQVIFSIAFSPDGKLLAIAGGPRAAILIDVITGKEIKRLKYPSDDDYGGSVSFSPDGKLLATAGVNDVERKDLSPILWNVATGIIIKKLPYQAEDVVFSPDGRFLLTTTLIERGAPARLVRLYDVVKDKEIPIGIFDCPYIKQFISNGKLIRILNEIWGMDGFAIAEFFKKDEFETTNEYMQRVKGIKFQYSTKITLGRYDADRGGFEIEVLGIRAFVPVEREKAKVIAANRDRVYIRGNLISAREGMLELVDVEFMGLTNKQ